MESGTSLAELPVGLGRSYAIERSRKYRSCPARGIGVIEIRQGHATEGLAAYQSGLAVAKSTSDSKLVADLMRLTGVAQRALGNFNEALSLDEQSLEINQKSNDTLGVIAALSGIGISYVRLGELRKAVENFEQCVKLGESIGSKLAVYRAIESLGNTYTVQGDHALALSYLEKSLALRKAGGASKQDLANIYINLIPAYRANGRNNDALEAASQALKLARESNDIPGVAYALLNRSSVYRKSRRYREALADVRDSLAIYETNKTPLEIAGALAVMAEIQADLDDNAVSLESALRAAELARRIPAPDILWQALASEGLAYQRMHRPRPARDAFVEGVATVDALRTELAGGEQQGLEFLRDKMGLYHGLLELHVEFGDNEDALRVAERAKAGLILDVLRAGRANITKAMSVAEKQRETQVMARLTEAQAQPRGDGVALEQATRELEAFRSGLYAAHPELKVRRGESEPLSLADAKALLPDSHAALLEFAVTPSQTYLFTITLGDSGKPDLRVFKLGLKEEALARNVELFRRQLASRDPSYRASAAVLYRQLFGAAAHTLHNRNLWAIVPDGPLWSLPFQALVEENGSHVIENRAVFTAPSLTVLLESVHARRSPAGGVKTVLAMGDPEARQLPRLPNAAREASAVSRLYGKGSVLLTGAEASEYQWKTLAAQHRVLHLAAHGVLNSANPLYSYIVLGSGHGDDGFVEAREILDLDLNAELVVLSGCETGLGGFHYGEGLVGLSWALMVAGSPTALVSQWKVDSASTTALMVAFHRALRTNHQQGLKGKAGALRAASLRLRQDAAFRHPYYWAGFVLVGDGY